VLSQLWEEEQSVVAETSAEHTLPLVSLKGLYIPLEGIAMHLVKDAGDALLKWI
jgi:hypothetical protein